MAGSVVRHAAAAVVDVRMAHHHGVDILRVDPSLFHAAQQPAGRRPEQFQAPHAGVEQDELVAGVDDECVLLQHHILERQEVVGDSCSPISGFVKPTKLSSGLPSGSVPSETMVPSKLPSLKR